MKYTSEQEELIEEIFKYYFEFHIDKTQRNNPSSSLFTKMFEVDRDTAQFAINEFCKIGHELGILIASKSGYGEYEVVSMDKIMSINFKNEGGFLKYFKGLDKQAENSQNINIGNNYGQIIAAGHNSIVSKNQNTTQSSSASIGFKRKQSMFVKVLTNGWTITIIGGLILAYLIMKFGWK